jgi:hypothetical protein
LNSEQEGFAHWSLNLRRSKASLGLYQQALIKTRQINKMSDPADTLTDSPIEPATSEALAEIITELEQYRERLVNDTLSMAQRAKIMKSQALASLEPSLAQIDAQIEALRQQQATLKQQ